ncbi:MAG: HupE/UreJ family protein [Lysobacterales bacterium]
MRALLWALLIWAGDASAHTLSLTRVALSELAHAPAAIRIDLPLRELALALPLDADGDGQLRWREVAAMQPQIERLLRRGLRIHAEAPCALTAGNIGLAQYDDGPALAWAGALDCGQSITRLQLQSNLLLDVDARHRTLVHLGDDQQVQVIVLSAEQPEASVELAAGSSVFAAFLLEGAHHILIGYDHLAFLICLLLVVVLRRSDGRWQALPRIGDSARAAALLVTAFTLAHSLTLSASALHWATPAAGWVEPAIALSIVLAALNNLYPVVHRRAWALAFGFGLVHGYGFAGALSELGLPPGAELSALFGFNLGVECGQLAIVALLLPLLHALARWPAYPRRLMAPASLLVGALGSYWLLQRLA